MLTTIRAVALRTIRHNDKTSILTAWSPSLGRLSLIMGAGNSSESRRRRALTMPLSLFETVIDIKQTNELLRPREIRGWSADNVTADLATHPVRAAVAMFAAEVLSVVTREGDADPALWQLVIGTVNTIAGAGASALANIPVAFLFQLAKVSGIAPDYTQYTAGDGLDMVEGVFKRTLPLHDYWMEPSATRAAVTSCRLFENYAHTGLLKMTRQERARMLETLITYFSLHHLPLEKLRSIDILKTVFNT